MSTKYTITDAQFEAGFTKLALELGPVRPVRQRRPRCYGCGDRAARWPKSEPRFCTKTCAADWADAMTESVTWNPETRTWEER